MCDHMDILLLTPKLNFLLQIKRLSFSKVESELVNLSHGGEHTKMHFLCRQAEVEHEESELSIF